MAREFHYNGQTIPDPDPSWSVDDVKNSLRGFYPGIADAEATTKKEGDKEIVTFCKAEDTKG